ncbi:MAG: hypothetical protein ACRDKL_02700 [Solirubrobacteraceae bacterium]
MAGARYEDLKPFQGRLVLLHSSDGETMRAKLISVDKEHGDVVVDVLGTNRPERYRELGSEFSDGSWVLPLHCIESFEAE